nr:hypothetical protein B0A51_04058 [Rachicladosporium sp. CCFEE 5018]
MISRLLFFGLLALLPLLVLAAEDYYKILDVSKDADERQLKKAYRKLSKQYHPDKNPDNPAAHEKFVEVSEAYDVLSDEELRKIYNQYGHEGVAQHKQGGQRGGGRDPFDVFSSFFGGGGHFGRGQRRGPNMEVRVHMPLRDFYVGAEHEFKVEKQAICSACQGSGSKDGVRETCTKCKGQGAILQKHMLAPGIFQQVQMQCDQCGGQRSTVKHACATCKGQRVVRAEEGYELVIERGMPAGVRVNYENEGDESPDFEAGDLVVNVVEKDPELGADAKTQTDGTFFRRKGPNLFWREVLSLREAWMGGWTRNLTHLDNHIVQLSRPVGTVVQPGTVEIIANEGMPVWQQGESGDLGFGALHVEYVVVLPDQMEKGMGKDFSALWEKWRKKTGVDLGRDSGRPAGGVRDEL